MSKTLLQITNQVLRRLRFAEATSVDQSSYTKLIKEFINETKREVEDAANWTTLRQTIQVTTSAGSLRYILTGAGNRWRFLENSYGLPDVFNDTDDTYLYKAPSMRWMSGKINDNDSTQNPPKYFDVNGQDSSGDPFIDLWPVPDDAYTINFNLVIPQDDLSNDGDTISVPEWPVALGALARALEDQGEDGGQSATNAWARYHDALADAIIQEENRTADSESSWTVV